MRLILCRLFLSFCAVFCLGLQARGIVITTPGLSINFNASAVPDSVKNAAGTELLSGQVSEGFYIQEANNSTRRFDRIADLGGGDYRFSIAGSPEQFDAHFGGAGDYLTVRFSAMSGFALVGERLKFRLYSIGEGLQAQALDYMISVRNTRSFVELERISLWESSPANPLGGFALYEYVDPTQEDDTLLDLWVDEGLPHPKVAGTWNRAAANAWLDAWIAMARDTSYLNIVPTNLAEHAAFLPHAKAMDAKALYLWNLIWRGEYWLSLRQNDEINPLMYPGGLADLQAFKTTSGRGLMLHYLSGNIGEEDVDFTKTTVSPDLQSWGAVTLNSNIGTGATTMIVTPDPGVGLPVIGTSSAPTSGPPVIPSFFDFKTFRIGSEWLSASSVTDLGNGTWQLNGVARGKWNTIAQSHPVGTSLRGYLRPYNQDFVPDPNSPLMTTIASRWATLNNTLGTSKTEFDGFENHSATGQWGSQKFAALVYENLDHPSTSNTSNGAPPAAWIEYKFNRVKNALGGPFQTRQHASLFLGDHSRITPGIEELENEMNKFLNVNNRGFSLGSYDVKGVSSSTLASYGQADEVLALLKNWKNASLPMTAAQRGAMDTFRPYLGARTSINGNHEWATALWRLDGSLLRKWHALGTDIYSHEWHFGQEHGTITPRFYVKNGQTQALEVPPELATGAQQTRIIGRVLPRYDAASASNIDLMGYLGGSSVTVARSNPSASAVWDDTQLTSHTINPSLDLRNNSGLGLWVTGDGSAATLVIRLRHGSQSRDHVVPVNFTGRQWIEIPTGEQGWRVKNWGWAVATRQTMDYQAIDSIAVGIGHLPANTSCSVLVEGLTALGETHEALVAPTLHLGEQSVPVNGTIATENHFILDPDGTFTVYDEFWHVVSVEHLGSRLLPVDLGSFRMQSASSANIWLEVGVQSSNATTSNPDTNPPVIWDGGGGNTAWSTATNWDADKVPDSSSDVEVGSWASVSAAPNTFASLKIEAGATVAFGTDTVSGGKTFDVAGTLDRTGVFRLTNSTVKLSGHLGSHITFLDTNNSTISFTDGAAFDNPGMSFEHKGTNTFEYKLSATGFRKMTAGFLYAGNGAVWSNATYDIDISDYDVRNGSTLTLVDYSGHAAPFDGPFNPTIRVFAGSTLLSATLAFDRVASALVLTVLFDPPTVTWDGGGGDASWTTAENWDADTLPGIGDFVIVGSAAAVAKGQTDFANLEIRTGATVSFAKDLYGKVLDVAGTMNRAGVFRINNSTVALSGSIGSSTTFLDTNGSTLNFSDGATFENAAMNFEHKGNNTFGYTLSPTGFQTLIAGRLFSGNGATWAAVTYDIDISSYDRSNGSTIVLADYSSHDTAYSGTFNPAVNIITGASGLVATLAFDKPTSRLLLTVNYDSNTVIWDGGGSDSAWTTAANWHTDSVPLATNRVVVGAGAVVSNGQNVFSNLTIEAGATVAFAGDTLSGSKTVNVAGTLDRAGVLRFNSTMELSGRLGPNITFLDTNGSTIHFVDGASFANANMSFEHKGANTFGYKLSAAGFTTIHAGTLRDGNGAVWADATYHIDISDYDISHGTSLVLADYTSHTTAFGGPFNPTVNIIAGTSGLHGTLGFNTTLSQLVLTVDPIGNDPPIAHNQSVSKPVNTAANFVMNATDPEGDSLTYAIVTGPIHGTLSGTAPNLTYTPANNFIGTDTLTFTASDGSLLSNTGTVTFAATPQTATQLWATLDTAIRTDALNTEWQTTWIEGAVTLHQIRYDLGTLTGTQRIASPKIAAYYAYPTGGTNLPGIVDIHGGGQRASVAEAKYWANQGYACISINWGGLPLNEALANTDWDGLPAGFVRTGVAHAIHREEPEGQVFDDGSTLFADAHPLNISYLLNAYAARRALTFLSAQGIIDSSKLGVTGHSMGGQTTVLTATDPRITCVTPSVGGSGYLYRDWWGLPGTARTMNSAHLDWYEKTADPQSYWPDITCPTLFLEASNDFNAPFDLVTKVMALQNPAVAQRLAVAPHFNHRFDGASYASRVLWQKAHLTGSFDFPETSVATLDLNQSNGIPLFSVWPDSSTGHDIVSVDIYYGYDRDSLTRFWRDAKAVETSPGLWQARCPVHDTNEPLVAFAIVTYDCGFDLAMPAGFTSPTRLFSVASEVKTVYPPDLANHGVRATETELRKIDDFSRGFHDWFILNAGHPTLFEFWTRKPNDPTWNGNNGSRLSFEVTATAAANSLGVTLQTAQWNSTASTEYHATVALNAAGGHAVSLQVSDFTNGLNEVLTAWDNVKLLRLSAGRLVDGSQAAWVGAIPELSNLRWEGGSYPEDFTTSKGTPNLWLHEHGLVVEGDYAAADLIDSDADGMKNWEEYQAGTDPNNPASVFHITSLSSAGNEHVLVWQAVAGKTYSVWFSNDLIEPNWSLKESGISGVEPTTSATIPSNGTRGFFRIGVAP